MKESLFKRPGFSGKLFIILMILDLDIFGFGSVLAQSTAQIFYDDFNNTLVNSQLWHIPTWVSSTDGTYLGRTQFRCTQNATLPQAINSQAYINIDTYNPTGYSFYGTDLISNKAYTPGKGLIFTIRAKINSPVTGGIVGGIFLYDLTCSCGAIHDEIDFELLTNDVNRVHTNIYSDEPLGTGHPDSLVIANPVTDYHTYVIKWLPTGVTWIVDDNIIRTGNISPTGPMHFHLNMWVPDIGWKSAYNGVLIPTLLAGSNQTYSMNVDWVKIDSLTDISTSVNDNKKSDVYFYPNPCRDQLFFSAPGDTDVKIYNTFGFLVLDGKAVRGALSVSGLSTGLYLIKYEIDGVIHSGKIIVR